MIPASIIGALFICALVPGFVFLRQTSSHRKASVRQSALEEAITLVTVGVAITAPTLIAVGVLYSSSVASQIRVIQDPKLIDGAHIRNGSVLLLLVLLVTIGAAFVAAFVYRRMHDETSGETAWFDVLDATFEDLSTFVEVELKDGRVIRGQIHTFDGIAAGPGRDLAIQAPLSYFSADQPEVELDASRLIVSELEIRTITVSYVDPATGERAQ